MPDFVVPHARQLETFSTLVKLIDGVSSVVIVECYRVLLVHVPGPTPVLRMQTGIDSEEQLPMLP